MAGPGDGEAKEGEDAAADHAADTDGDDLGQTELGTARAHATCAPFESLPKRPRAHLNGRHDQVDGASL